MAKEKKQPKPKLNPDPDSILKYEIARELGLDDKIRQTGWKSLSAKESGRIGGLMTKKKRELAKNNQSSQNS